MDKMSLGFNLTVIGLGTVFLVLFLLQLMMNIEEWFFKITLAKQKMDKPNGSAPSLKAPTASEAAPLPPPQIIAAIIGAIACQTGRSSQNFRLVNVRRIKDREASSSWNLQGRTNLINTRSNFYAKGGSK